MSILDFEKPVKVKIDAGFDGGPTGGYVPQMSVEDARKWKANHFNKGKEGERIEIRKSFKECQILIIVGKDGWNYSTKHEVADVAYEDSHWPKIGTKGKNVRISLNGPLKLSWAEWDEMVQAVAEAKRLFSNPFVDEKRQIFE